MKETTPTAPPLLYSTSRQNLRQSEQTVTHTGFKLAHNIIASWTCQKNDILNGHTENNAQGYHCKNTMITGLLQYIIYVISENTNLI